MIYTYKWRLASLSGLTLVSIKCHKDLTFIYMWIKPMLKGFQDLLYKFRYLLGYIVSTPKYHSLQIIN